MLSSVSVVLVQLSAIPRDDPLACRIGVVEFGDDGGVLPLAAQPVDDLPLMAVDVMVDDEAGGS